MATRFNCPVCGQALTLPDRSTAEAVKCPKCGQRLRLKPRQRQADPETAAPSPPAPPSSTPPPPPSRPAHPALSAAGSRPAPRTKHSSRLLWLAGLGAVAATVTVFLVSGVFSRSPDSVSIFVVNETDRGFWINVDMLDSRREKTKRNLECRLTPRGNAALDLEAGRFTLGYGAYDDSGRFVSGGVIGVCKVEQAEKWRLVRQKKWPGEEERFELVREPFIKGR